MRAVQERETIETFAPDLQEDWLDRVVFAWGWCGPALGLVLLCVTLGVGAGLGAGLGHALLYVFVLAPLINGLGHWRGAQKFADTASNLPSPARVEGGDSRPNNHPPCPPGP